MALEAESLLKEQDEWSESSEFQIRQIPTLLQPLLKQQYGWLVLAILPAVILSAASFALGQCLGSIRLPGSVWTTAFAAANEEFPVEQHAVLADGLCIPTIDPADVCIVQADTRPVSVYSRPDYQGFNLTTVADMAYPDATLRHNMLYALRHGYRFLRFQTVPIDGLYRTWSKMPAIRKAVEECKWTMFLDSDAYVNKPQYSLQELLRHWGFHQKASFLQAMDPEDSPTVNFNTTNTGFWIIRNTELAKRSLDELIRCPTDTPGCAEWAMKWANEQTAWTRYIRPKLVEGIDLILVSCWEANGYWFTTEGSGTGHVERCKGSLITHGWQAKPNIAGRIEKILSGEIANALQHIIDVSMGESLGSSKVLSIS